MGGHTYGVFSEVHRHRCARLDGVASDLLATILRRVLSQVVRYPPQVVANLLACYVLDLFAVGIPKCVAGGVGCGRWEGQYPVCDAGPDGNRAVLLDKGGVMSDCVMIVVVFLGDECNRHGVGGVNGEPVVDTGVSFSR